MQMVQSTKASPSLRRLTIFSRPFTAASSSDAIKASDNLKTQSLSTINTKTQLLKSYKITPPIKPWPQKLFPKRLVSIIASQQNLDLALQIFDYAGKYHPHFTHNYETYQAIIQRLSRARAFETVESLLAELKKSNINCGENLFIIVIRNYGIASKPKQALKMFLRIKEFGVRASVRSFNTLLNALIQNKEFELVYVLFRNCRRKFDVVPNVFTCNLLIKGLCKKGDVEGAIRVLDEIPGMGMVPNVVSYTTVLSGYVARGDMVGAKRVFDEILDRGWLPDATTYTILMDGFVKTRRLVDAIKVMDEMEENGVQPNEVTYGVMIDAFCKEKKSGEAANLLNDMLDKKYIPSSTLCCKLIDLLCEEGKVEDACNLWKKLLIKNITPDNAVSSTLIHWLCKEGKVQRARSLFNEFDRGSVPSLLTYNTLIAGMCENGELCEAGRLWDDMVEKGCEPNAFTYNMLIKGFCKGGNTKGGIRILEEMLDKGCLPNKLTFSILIKGLCDSGSEAEISRVLHLVASKGHEVGTDCWVASVTKFISDIENPGVVLDRVLLENGLMQHHEEIVDDFNTRGVSVIFLFRRNLLRRMVSILGNSYDQTTKPLNGTHKSHTHSSEEAAILAKSKPTITPTTLVHDLKLLDDMVKNALEYFKVTRHIILDYEDVVKILTHLMDV